MGAETADRTGQERYLAAENAALRQQLAAAEQRTREGNDRYGLILNSAVDYGIIALDLDGLVTEWNEGARRIMGWTAAEMLGKPAAMFFTEEDRRAAIPQKEMTAALERGRGADERWHLTKDGSRFWANGEMMPLKDAAGLAQGFIKILRDRTQQRLEAEKNRADAEFLQGVLASSGDCIKVLDLDGKLTFMNEGGKQIMEVSDFNAILGCPWPDFWQGAGLADAKAALALAKDGKVGRFQGMANTMAKNPKWWDVQVTPIMGADGRPERILSVSRDITVTKLDEALRAALMRLSDSLRNLDDIVSMAGAAAEIVGRTLSANAAGYGWIDASGERLIIERDWAVKPSSSIAAEHHMRDYGSYIDDLLNNRTVAITDTRSDERTAAHWKQFEAFGVRALLNAPIVERGRLSALFCVLTDVVCHWTTAEIEFVQQAAEQTRLAIERRRAEQELQFLAGTLQKQVEQRTRERDRTWQLSRDMLGVADEQGIWLSVNPAWSTILGWPEDAFIGRTSEWLEHPDDSAKTRAEIGQLAEGQTTFSFENRFRKKSGGYCDLMWSAVPVEGLLYCVARDVTDQKERQAELATMQEQLAQSQKMEAVGQLTGGLAHDFNNLLAVITGSLELLEKRIGQGRFNDIERFMSASQTAAKRATSLTHRLLAFSRRQTLDPQLTNANVLMNGMAELIRRTVGPEITVEIAGAPELWTTLVDPNQLENALLNLCINARDAMPDGGRIMVEASNKTLDKRSAKLRELPAGEFVVLAVSDTGTGMPPDVVARVFEPFFTTKPIGQGTGLGLSMVYGFARQSDGQVRIHSEVGQGTTINIYLPRAHGTSKKADESLPEQPVRAKAGQTVLVVDDEANVRMLVVDVLEELGYTAVEAHDGQAGLKVLESDLRVDLLVTDVGMPGMNGRQLADAGRVLRPDLKVMFITGYAEAAVVSHGHLEPGMAIITKPFRLDDLANRVKALIGQG